jgi:excisionase family DNA binding protein
MPFPRQSAPEDRLLTISEAAQLSRVNEKVIRKAVEQGTLCVVTLGPKSFRIRFLELQTWWKSHEAGLFDHRRFI